MHFLSFMGIIRKQIKQPGYQCSFLFLYSTEMKLLQLIQTTTDLMMLMLRDGYFPFKLIWLQLKCVLQPWTGLADISCTYAASSDPPTCTWRAWTVKESVKIPLLLGFITYKTNQLILRCHRADFSLVERNGLYSEKKKWEGAMRCSSTATASQLNTDRCDSLNKVA